VLVAFLAGLSLGRPWFEQVRFVACSPDGNFRLEAIKTEWTPFTMPGQGGDGGGYIRLVDNYSRLVLRQSPHLPQVSSFSHESYAWNERAVTVKLDAENTITEHWLLSRHEQGDRGRTSALRASAQ